ncbi:unnamed protein product [Symbiodinium sp. CCMP2456]|nr:unnamed protein product [Symbiodinium sp. CCMP2456]
MTMKGPCESSVRPEAFPTAMELESNPDGAQDAGTEPVRVLELFAGIGGMRLALSGSAHKAWVQREREAMPVGGYSLAESPNKGAVTGGANTMFPSRGLANAGMQQMSPRFPAKTGGPSPSINTRGQFDDLEQKFKFWVNGSEAGKSALWKAWDAIDYNGNNIVSLAEIDRWVVDTYPQLNNKPALMRAYKACDLNQDSYVNKREFAVLLRDLIYFNKVWSVFDGIDADRDRRLTMSEFRSGLSLLGMSSVVNPKSLFDSLDRNRCGLILFDEFCRWVASVQCPVDSSVYTAPAPSLHSPSAKHHSKVAVHHSHSAKTQIVNQFEVAEKKLHGLLKDKRQLHQLWRKMDYNGNGLVSLAEMDGCVTDCFPEANNKPALMRAYKATERNPDGYVHKTEFRALLRNMFYFNKLYSLYEVVDVDDDRRMDLNEFRGGCSVLGLKLTPAEAFDEFNFMDENGGGKVLFDEFCKWAASKKLPID